MQLKLSKVQETVTVTSATPLIDTRKVETGQNFSHDELAEIPTSRDVWSLIQQVPGVQLDTVNVAGNQSAIVGGPDFIDQGLGQRRLPGRRRDRHRQHVRQPASARQNGGTNTFFDFSTFEDVEVATGGSMLEQQNSGVTINVVTKRGTNEIKGSARYLYASGNWQSNNTPPGGRRPGPADEQHAVHPRVRRRPRRADRQGQAVAVGRRLAIRRSRLNTATFDSRATSSTPETTNLEPWSAKLNWQISNANSAALYYQRSDRDRGRTVARRPIRPPETLIEPPHPDELLQGRGLERLLVGLLRVDLRELPNPTTRARQRSRDCAAPIRLGTDKDIQYYANSGRLTGTTTITTTAPRIRRSRRTCRCRSSSTRASSTTR